VRLPISPPRRGGTANRTSDAIRSNRSHNDRTAGSPTTRSWRSRSPHADGRFLVSTDGGTTPRWSADGKEVARWKRRGLADHSDPNQCCTHDIVLRRSDVVAVGHRGSAANRGQCIGIACRLAAHAEVRGSRRFAERPTAPRCVDSDRPLTDHRAAVEALATIARSG
jgi:hypothetical protein